MPSIRADVAPGASLSPDAVATRARKGLITAGVVAGAGLVISGTFAATGLGIPCPFRQLTGWDCPLCGGTRMGAALLHGDVGAAWAFNPVALILLVAGAVVTAGWMVEAVRRAPLRPLDAARTVVARVPERTWWVVGVSVAVAWVLARNLIGPHL